MRHERNTGLRFAAACAGLLVAAAPVAAQPGPAQPGPAQPGPAQQRALTLLRALRSYDAAVIKHFVEQDVAPAARAKRPAGAWVGSLLNETERLRGGAFVRWGAVSDTAAQLVYRNDLVGRLYTTGVTVERDSPHRVVAWTPPRALPSEAPTPPPAGDRELASRLHGFAQRTADYDFFSGAVLVMRGDTPVLARAYGLAERNFRVPNRLDTKFRVASITKMFTAVAVGQLVERGRVSLDDRLAKFVPDAPGADRVRIRHLLNHTSGMGDVDLRTFRRANPADFRDLDAWIDVADKVAPAAEPGTAWGYNNLAYTYLGKVIERASGEDYYRYVVDHVFKPAGMNDSACWDYDYVVPNMGYPYELSFALGAPAYQNMMIQDGGKGSASGCATSTVEDMARFARALRAGTLLRPQTFREFTTPTPESGAERWGLGFYSAPLGRSDIMTVGHGGNLMGACTEFRMFEHQGAPWTVVVLSNSGVRNCYLMVRETTELLGQMLTRPAK